MLRWRNTGILELVAAVGKQAMTCETLSIWTKKDRSLDKVGVALFVIYRRTAPSMCVAMIAPPIVHHLNTSVRVIF